MSEGAAPRLRRTPVTEGEVLQRLQHLEQGQDKLEKAVEKLDSKIDRNHATLIERFERRDNRDLVQMGALGLTLITAVVSLLVTIATFHKP